MPNATTHDRRRRTPPLGRARPGDLLRDGLPAWVAGLVSFAVVQALGEDASRPRRSR